MSGAKQTAARRGAGESDLLGRFLDSLSSPPSPVILGLAAAFAGAAYLGTFLDGDIYYIIALGRSIIESGIPTTDPLTCNEGLDCVAQQWLFCLGAAMVDSSLGLRGVAAACALSWVFAALAMFACARTFEPARPRAAAVCTGAALFIMSMFVKTNPRAIDVICLCVCAIAAERALQGGRRRWLAVPACCSAAMANLHCSMWVLAAIPLACALADGRARGLRAQICAAGLSACLASLLSPYGPAGTLFIFRSLAGGLETLGIQELQPTIPSLASCGILALTPAALAAYALLRGRALKGLSDVRLADALVAVLGVLALLQMRNVLLLLAVAPAAAPLACREPLAGREGAARRLATLFVAAAAVVMLALSATCRDTLSESIAASRCAAAAALEDAGVGAGASIGNDFNSGSFLEYCGFKPAFDGRAELILPQVNGKEDLTAAYEALKSGTDGYALEWVERGEFDALWLAIGSDYAYQNERLRMAAAEAGYELVYADEYTEAYARK